MTNGDNFDSAKAREDFARVAEDQRARILQMAASEPEDRLAALKRRSQQARIERAAYLKENPPPPRPPAVMNPEPIGEQRAPLEVQPRDEVQEQIDFIRWVMG